jgi:SAM-dependent methyltransferase
MYHGAEYIEKFVPNNHSKQVSSKYMVDRLIKQDNIHTILDLGCGSGDSIDYFQKVIPGSIWVGIDLIASPEVNSRRRKGINLCSYDGINIPFGDKMFDLVFFHQVLEHVHEPYELIKEIGRILKPEGFLVGSVSHLEPFHSLSVVNYTPYGLSLLLKKGRLSLLEIRPGIDVLNLILYRISGTLPPLKRYFSRFFDNETLFNKSVGLIGRILGKNHQNINLLKLLFCGQFRFIAKKEED